MHVFTAILGVWLLFLTLRSMIRIALMNRHYRDVFATAAGRGVHTIVALRLGANRDAKTTHPVLLWVFPAYILSLILLYFGAAMTAFALLYWGTRAAGTWRQAFLASGSALNTLGFATPASVAGKWLSVPEGALGLGIVVFLFTFIPSYQTVIRQREDKTSWLYVRTGDNPSGMALLEWCQRGNMQENMREVWEGWEDWFRMLGDTHSVLPMLTMSPSVQSGQSWVLAAATVLDASALAASFMDTKDGEAARICVQTGTRALLAIAEALGSASSATDRRSVCPSNGQYEAARDRLRAAGIPLKPAADEGVQWQEFLSLRNRYDDALRFVASRTFTPMDGVLVDMLGPSFPVNAPIASKFQ
jgi:hypothetical protein